jgi:hypothetical protein
MGHNVIVAKRRHNGYGILLGVRAILAVAGFPEHLSKLADNELVLVYDLLRRTWNLFIVVVPRRVAGPDDEIDLIFEMLLDPPECLVD